MVGKKKGANNRIDVIADMNESNVAYLINHQVESSKYYRNNLGLLVSVRGQFANQLLEIVYLSAILFAVIFVLM